MNRTRLVAVPLVLGLAGALGGCTLLNPLLPQGGSTPTPTVVGSAEAASAFTDTICSFNDAAFAFDATWSDLDAPLRDLQAAALLGRVEAEEAKRHLEAVRWPTDIAADVVVIQGYLQERVDKLDSVISAGSVEELEGIDFTTPEEVNSAAAEVEAFLQLGADYCPAPDDPDEPSDPAAELATSAWAGSDSDGDETELLLRADGSASVTVAGVAYDGTWQLVSGILSVDVTRTDNALAFSGFFEPGATALAMSGTASNGHRWTVQLQRS
jgi:hypothetical protein